MDSIIRCLCVDACSDGGVLDTVLVWLQDMLGCRSVPLATEMGVTVRILENEGIHVGEDVGETFWEDVEVSEGSEVESSSQFEESCENKDIDDAVGLRGSVG